MLFQKQPVLPMTPAVNSFSFLQGSSQRDVYFGPSPTRTPVGNPQRGVVSEIRPNSVSHAIRSDGWRPCGSWSHYGVNGRLGSGSIEYIDHGYRTVASGNILAYTADVPRARSVSVNTTNAAYTKALANAADQKTSLLQFALEIDKTIDLIAVTFLRIARDIAWFKRRFPRWWKEVIQYQGLNQSGRNRALWCKIPRLWLELQYGWKPDLQDIVGAINAIAERGRSQDPVIVAEGKFTDVLDDLLPLQSFVVGGIPLPSLKVSLKESAHCKLYFGIDNAGLLFSSQLGLINIADVIWELVPWSFVYDWAIPIGTWLISLGGAAGLKYIDGYVSQKVWSVRSEVTDWGNPGPGYVKVSETKIGVRHEEKHFARLALPILDVPQLYVKSPFSVTHAANALALVANNLFRLRV